MAGSPFPRVAQENGHATRHGTHPKEVCIVAAARTPMGGFMGVLSSLPATQLGSVAIKEAVRRSGLEPADVEEVVMGNVLSANLGQAPARQASMGAGLPESVVATTVNKVCASGMKAIALAAQSIMLGINEVVVAGGMESMSNAPYYLSKARGGYRFGNAEIMDGMQRDGLCDAYADDPMGCFAETCAEEYNISRADQDDHAVRTHERAAAANAEGAFEWEIVPVEVKGGKGRPAVIVDRDEACAKFDEKKLRNLRPCFKEHGTVTAGNASAISDGAAAVVLVSRGKADSLGLKVLAVIRGFADAEQAPDRFTTAPALAIPRALKHARIDPAEVDCWEINEAFSVVALANQKLLSVPEDRLNVHGGAVALGHPLGCSGARIIVTLLGVLRRKGGQIGVAGVCNGGGGASAMVIEAESLDHSSAHAHL
ncbi:hypothetical protein CLOM_g17764 [Closterium sp. NIES-68]|nr:hypothetical protein CLOM_g17764 [Closterium sp. NIES-68]GJP62059.1 hypothetical protein CLOP_g19160 [Closterium sp. NIES-67]